MTPENARDIILQGAAVRAEPVTLPPTVIVPPGQLGSGTLPAGVLAPSGVPFGQLAGQNSVNLASQVVGALAAGSVSGLGALAMVSSVNAATQVYNLGNLAYANNLAADQIGAGVLAAGVIYAGEISASRVSAGDFSGRTFTGGTFSGADFVGSKRLSVVNVFGSTEVLINSSQTGATPGMTIFSGYVDMRSAGSQTFFADSSMVTVNVPLNGSVGSRVVLAETERYCSININGVVSNGSIRIGGLV